MAVIFLLAPSTPHHPGFPHLEKSKTPLCGRGENSRGRGLPESRKGCHSNYAEPPAAQLAGQKTTSRLQTGKCSSSRHSKGKFTGKIQTRSREEHLTQGTTPSLGWDMELTVELGPREEDENKGKGRAEDPKALWNPHRRKCGDPQLTCAGRFSKWMESFSLIHKVGRKEGINRSNHCWV